MQARQAPNEQQKDFPVEPPPCSSPFTAEYNGRHYNWRGIGPGQRSIVISVYDSRTEQWSLLPTTGPPPPGEWGGRSVCVGRYLYTFGGGDGSSWHNDMYSLDLERLHWTKVQTSGSQPIKKFGCGLISVDERTLCCSGGHGIGPTQPGSTFTKDTRYTDGSGWTNEFHLFDVQTGVWSSPELKGERPPPCAYFTFTKVDRHRAIFFGGRQPDHRVNNVYVFNFSNMEVTKVEPVQGEPWPVGMSVPAACCLRYGEDHPQLLVYGGVDNDKKALGDMWILNVDTGKWTEFTPSESVQPRYNHSTTAISLGPALIEVLVFGGRREWLGVSIAETTILRFELTGPSPGKWALVDVAYNDTRGSAQRLGEKRIIRRATARASLVMETSNYSSQYRVRALEQQLLASEQREQDTQHHCELLLQGKDRELAAQGQELTAKDRELAAERRNLATKKRELIEANHRCTDAERQLRESQQTVQDANRREADLYAQITALRVELEGKTKELAAHNTEVWRIPASRVRTMRTIGTGGWGEVLEGTVKVAVKRLFAAIVNLRNLERLQREMRLLAEVRHPNLVQFIGAVFDQSPPLIITELLDMNLRQAYEMNQLVPGNRLSIFIDIAQALDYLHQRYEPIIHRDVSAPNVLLQQMPNHQWKGKVSDLGSANFLQQAQTMGEGAIIYSPPEVIPQAADPFNPPLRQSVKIDVYSYGIVLCEVIASRFPSAEHYREMILQVQRERPIMCELIVRCTKRDPSDRLSMAQVLVELNKIVPF